MGPARCTQRPWHGSVLLPRACRGARALFYGPSCRSCRRWGHACRAQVRGDAVVEAPPAEPTGAPTLPPPPADPSSSGSSSASAPGTTVSDKYRPFLGEWDKGFFDATEELGGYWMELVEGQLPADLEGTLFRVGPGKFSIGGQEVAHPYDADGFVTSTAIRGGQAYFRSRFVRTAEYVAEEERGGVLFRGTFATQRPGGAAANALDVYVKNTSNTNVAAWAGKLWSLFEAGQPYRLDPATLETLGLEGLEGQLPPGLPFDMKAAPVNAMLGALATLHQRRLGTLDELPPELFRAGGEAATAHPHYDSNTGRLVGFSYQVQPGDLATGALTSTEFHFWELDAQGRIAVQRRYSMPGYAFVHDFAVTESYYVFMQNPVTVANAQFLMGSAPAGSCVKWVPDTPTIVHLVPRPCTDPALTPRTFPMPSCFIFHHANAYEEDSGRRVVVDSIHYDSLPAVGKEALAAQGVDGDVAFKSRLRRLELDLGSGALRVATLADYYLEMPAVNEAVQGRRHRFVYGYKSKFFDGPQIGIAKIDTEGGGGSSIWMPGFQRFCSEPKFVARSGATEEDDGWLLTVINHSGEGRSYLAVLDAQRLGAGPVALLRHRSAVPSALHGCWSPVCYGQPAAAPQPAEL